MKLRNKNTGEICNKITDYISDTILVISTKNGDTICGNTVVASYDREEDLCKEWEDWEESSEIDEHKNLMLALQEVFKQYSYYGDEDMFSRMANVIETGEVYQGTVIITDLHDKLRRFGITINEINKEEE